MTEHKYTDEKVIRALERCVEGTSEACHVCTFGINPPYPVCKTMVEKLALDLINRQKAEISALTSAVDNSTQEFLKLHDKYQDQRAEIAFWMDAAENAKKEAVKEFAEKLKEKAYVNKPYGGGKSVDECDIDALVKEMTEI